MGNYACYASLTDFKNALPGTGTADDAALFGELETVSRWIEAQCGRHFSVRSETRYFTAKRSDRLLIDDLLSVTTLKTLTDNSGGTRTYGDVWAATDYDLEPYNDWPKTAITINPGGSYSFPSDRKGVELVGLYGYGDGETATPYEASGATITVANGTATTVVPSDQSLLAVGQTILVESEQMYVRSLTDGGLGADSATVYRGVNGTTAAAHATAAASIYRYPDQIRKACLLRAAQLWMLKQGPMGSMAGGEFGAVSTATVPYAVILDLLSEFKKVEAA